MTPSTLPTAGTASSASELRNSMSKVLSYLQITGQRSADGRSVHAAQVSAFLTAAKVYSDALTRVAVSGVTVLPGTSTGAAASTVQLAATVAPAEASQVVTWSSSDPTKATVSSTGLVTRVATGSATITATSASDPTKTGTSTITIS